MRSTTVASDDDYSGPERRRLVPVTIDESWTKFLGKMGLGGIAVFLVWQLSGDIKASIATTAQAVQQTSVSLQQHVTETKTQTDERDRILRMLLNVAVQQCVNATAIAAKRDACFTAVNGGIREPR